jgi:ABC-type phosphate/phosphonate transport system substrate-binding protein
MTMKTTSVWQHVRVCMAVAFCWSAAACNPEHSAPTAERPAPPPVAEPELTTPTTTTEAPREATLILSTIADNPQEEKDKDTEAVQFLPYLASHLRAYGITSAKLVYCHSPAEMAQWMKEGKVDLFDESPFASYLENRLSGGADEVILNRWKNANEKFGGVLFTKADGPITKLDDLKGKLVAFRGDTSTTQYFLQRALLAAQGYKLVEVAQTTEKVKPNEIGFYFAWSSRDKVTEDVMDGTAAAGGNSDEFIDKLLGHFGTEEGGRARHPRAGLPEIHKEQLRILARTPLAMRRIVTIRKALDPKLKAAVKDLLLAMDSTPEGQAVLKSFGPAKRFTAIDAATAYAGIADQGALIEDAVKKFSRQ